MTCFDLLVDAQDKARKDGSIVWALVAHCPGFVFKVFPGGRTIKYSLGIIEARSAHRRPKA